MFTLWQSPTGHLKGSWFQLKLYIFPSLSLSLSLSFLHTHFLLPLSLSYTRSLAVRLVRSTPPGASPTTPQPLGSVCAQRGADNPGQDNRNRPPFVLASMGLMTVTVNSGHRLRPGWVSSTEGPLTRRTKAETQSKMVFESSVNDTRINIYLWVLYTNLNILSELHIITYIFR